MSGQASTLPGSGACSQDATATLYVMVNAHWEPLEFVVQEGRPNEWQRVVDTARERPDALSGGWP